MAEQRTVLVMAPHPDDETFGCGGAIAAHVDHGDRVVVAFLTSGELALKHLSPPQAWAVREAEAASAAAVLGIAHTYFLRQPDWMLGDNVTSTAAALIPILAAELPQRLYLPHPLEWHPDHKAASAVLNRALQEWAHPAVNVLTYEVWTPLSEYEHVQDITRHWRKKLDAIRCYRSQIGHFRYDRAIQGLNRYRGELAARTRYAEVFGTMHDGEAG